LRIIADGGFFVFYAICATTQFVPLGFFFFFPFRVLCFVFPSPSDKRAKQKK
jgi:hypothetical protein